jgi:hypothetical protein
MLPGPYSQDRWLQILREKLAAKPQPFEMFVYYDKNKKFSYGEEIQLEMVLQELELERPGSIKDF